MELFAHCHFCPQTAHRVRLTAREGGKKYCRVLLPFLGSFIWSGKFISAVGKTRRSCGPGWFPRRAGAVLGSRRWQKSPAVPKGLVYLNSPSVQGQERRSTSARRGQSKHPENLLTSNTLLKRAGGNVAFCQIFPPLFIYQKQWNVYSGSTLTPAHGATGLFCSCLFKQGQLIIFN